MSGDFNVFTSIRSDHILHNEAHSDSRTVANAGGVYPLYLVGFHRDRLVQACKAFGRESKALEGDLGLRNFERQLQAGLSKFLESDKQDGPVKLRLEFTKQQTFHVTASYVPTVPFAALYPESLNQIPVITNATYRIFMSPVRTQTSLFTKHKSTNRRQYDEQRALLPSQSGTRTETGILQEILLVNESRGEIMEGSITTPYFSREEGWVTPYESCGGHLGVTRRWALMRSLAKEDIILANDLKVGEVVILSNGVRGFGWGKIEAFKV